MARSATWALFALKDADLSILHLNTHLDHVSTAARREGSKLIIEKIAEITDYMGETPAVILTGDFNARPDSATHNNLTRSGFIDTYLAAGHEEDQDANTFHAFEGTGYRDKHPARGPRRIDWILLGDPRGSLRTESHSIIRDAEEDAGLYPSDHYPIVADFTLQE